MQSVRLGALLGLVVAAALAASCQSDQGATRPSKENLPPLRPPAENLFCAISGTDGVGMPPRPPTPQQLSREEVANFLAPRTSALNECYESRIRRGYAIEGNVGVRFMVTPQGYVKQICLVEEATGDADFVDCLFGEIGTWQFPKKTETTEVRHRWRFKHSVE